MKRTSVLAVLLALALAAPGVASSVAAGPRPMIQRQVRGYVARVEALPGAPSSRVWVFVLEDYQGSGSRWVRLRVPGRRDGTRVVVAAGMPLPKPGDRALLTLRRRDGEDWLLSAPDDWRTLRPGERP